MMTATEITTQSWFSRLGSAMKGIVVGLILIAAAAVLIFWNEGRAVRRHKTLMEGGGIVVSVPSDIVDSSREGKLIHVSGMAHTGETVSDADFGIFANALRLKRRVDMYQWNEKKNSTTKKKLGGGTETVTTYSYEKIWSDHLLESGDFKDPAEHRNPTTMKYKTQEYTAGDVALGAFSLTDSLVGMIDNFEKLSIPNTENLPEEVREKAVSLNGGFYLGADPAMPKIGDMKIGFEVVRPTEVSIVARQAGESLMPYVTEAGGAIQLLQVGLLSADSMFQAAKKGNRLMTWILRCAGFLLMVLGFGMIFKPLSVLADVLPPIGSLVGMGAGLVSLLMAGVVSLITGGVAWIVYRPLLGAALMAGAAAVIAAIFIMGKEKKSLAAGVTPGRE